MSVVESAEVVEGAEAVEAAAPTVVVKTDLASYSGMLIATAVFYLIAIVATMAEMAPYCSGFISDLF